MQAFKVFELERRLLPLRPLITQQHQLQSDLRFVVATLGHPLPAPWRPRFRCRQHLMGITLEAVVSTGEA
ncbi:MAG: hypothetical protein DCF18_03860 [Cyanobium sp.]|uniref:hypothetical protein n=1 Tax=Synechococcus sp. CS-1333 TaxID=2848638 RepID=UPI000DBC4258|nr:hypothetical protein [Synechococcus sp. CS-1333]MCT0210224.1 hypothetical protein [Synechococcus sp. CS-1333]PZV24149.1 MAG: hypothetical protein DCF18_03860 [Cyanobium sp.]